MPGVAELALVLIENQARDHRSRLRDFQLIRAELFSDTSVFSFNHAGLSVSVAYDGDVDGWHAADGPAQRFGSDLVSVSLSDGCLDVSCDAFGESRFCWRRLDDGAVVIGPGLDVMARFPGSLHLDTEAVVDTLLVGVPIGETTYLQGVRRLSWPSSQLTVRSDGDNELIVTAAVTANRMADPADLTPSSFIHLVNDRVPRSATRSLLLSGGLDSALLSAALVDAKDHRDGSLTALTFGSDTSADVLRAREVARSMGLAHEVIKPSVSAAVDSLAQSVVASERPVGSPVLPAVMGRAREVSDYVITGEGADQVFGGSWFLRRDAVFRRELAHRWTVFEPMLDPGVRSEKGSIIRDLTVGETDERCHRLWRFEVRQLIAARCVSVMGGHASAAGVRAGFPYLNADFVSFIDADPLTRLKPFGWKPSLRRLAAALLPRSISGSVLESHKTPPGDGVAGLIGEVDRRLGDAMPPGWLDTHPIRRLAEQAGEILGAYQVAMFDIFVVAHIVSPGSAASLSTTELYTDTATRRGIRAGYDAIERIVGAT